MTDVIIDATKETPEKESHVIEVRNLMRVSAVNITCEVLHKDHGWIPFSAFKSEIETNEYAAAVFAHIKENKVRVGKLPECPSVVGRLETNARVWRDEELSRADILINRIEDFEIEGDSKLWRQYRVALRNWPSSKGFPKVDSRPVAPDAEV